MHRDFRTADRLRGSPNCSATKVSADIAPDPTRTRTCPDSTQFLLKTSHPFPACPWSLTTLPSYETFADCLVAMQSISMWNTADLLTELWSLRTELLADSHLCVMGEIIITYFHIGSFAGDMAKWQSYDYEVWGVHCSVATVHIIFVSLLWHQITDDRVSRMRRMAVRTYCPVLYCAYVPHCSHIVYEQFSQLNCMLYLQNSVHSFV